MPSRGYTTPATVVSKVLCSSPRSVQKVEATLHELETFKCWNSSTLLYFAERWVIALWSCDLRHVRKKPSKNRDSRLPQEMQHDRVSALCWKLLSVICTSICIKHLTLNNQFVFLNPNISWSLDLCSFGLLVVPAKSRCFVCSFWILLQFATCDPSAPLYLAASQLASRRCSLETSKK